MLLAVILPATLTNPGTNTLPMLALPEPPKLAFTVRDCRVPRVRKLELTTLLLSVVPVMRLAGACTVAVIPVRNAPLPTK